MAFSLLAPAVQDALATAIAAQLPAGVPCSLGYPAGGPQAEHVWIAGDFDAELPRYVSGGGARDELASLMVRILVTQRATDYEPVRDRALVLAGAVEAALGADPTLGGLVVFARIVRGQADEAIPEATTRAVGLTLTIRYQGTATAAG